MRYRCFLDRRGLGELELGQGREQLGRQVQSRPCRHVGLILVDIHVVQRGEDITLQFGVLFRPVRLLRILCFFRILCLLRFLLLLGLLLFLLLGLLFWLRRLVLAGRRFHHFGGRCVRLGGRLVRFGAARRFVAEPLKVVAVGGFVVALFRGSGVLCFLKTSKHQRLVANHGGGQGITPRTNCTLLSGFLMTSTSSTSSRP